MKEIKPTKPDLFVATPVPVDKMMGLYLEAEIMQYNAYLPEPVVSTMQDLPL